MKQDSLRTSNAQLTLYPLAWLAAAFAVGVLLSSVLTLSTAIWLIGVIPAGLGAFILKYRQLAASTLLLLAFICAGGLFHQVEYTGVRPNRLKVLYDNNSLRSGEFVEVTGTVSREPEPAINGFFLWIDSDTLLYQEQENKVSGTVRLFIPINNEPINNKDAALRYETLSLGAGDKVAVSVELKREERYLNPGVRSAKGNLDRQGIDATGTIKDVGDLKKLSTGNSPTKFIYQWRKQLLTEFQTHFNGPTAGVMIASLLGNKYFLDRSTGEAFREGGTFHMLVISGAHITLLGALIVWLLSFITRRRMWLFLVSNFILWAYTLAVGAEAPVTRAALMFTILSFSYVVQRQGTLLNALGASALMLLVWKPSELFDPSFQLTFTCVFAIVAVALPLLQKMEAIGAWYPTAKEPLPPNCPRLFNGGLKTFCEILFWREQRWRREQKRSVWQCVLFKTKWAAKLEENAIQPILRFVFAAIFISVIVQIWLLPFLVVYFHRLSPAGIILNLFVGILLAAETVTALFSVLTAQVSITFAAPFVWLTENLNWLMLHSVDPFDVHDAAALRIPAYTGAARIVYAIYFLPLVALWVAAIRWDPFALKTERYTWRHIIYSPQVSGCVLPVLSAIIIFHPFSASQPDSNLRIDFLDVGQGDSALITFPGGTTMLIDGGGRFNFSKTQVIGENGRPVHFEPDSPEIGEAVVSEFLWQRGLDRVDYLVATHGDIDHIQGLSNVARNFFVQTAIVGAGQKPSENLRQFYDTLARRNIPIVETARGDVFRFGEVTVEILSPSAKTVQLSENNNSLVLRITFGERSFLFTGDIEKEAEEVLLEDLAKLKCDLIKVPHHGSRSSSSEKFVEASGAKTAVISVGRDSLFGHPHPEITRRWAGSGAIVMTTGANGTITVITDGHNIRSDNYLGGQTHQ
ncbi:MAG TPA: ComEC/Rec2 family competence protein [Pyrinomonadaceae bacterium]|jgi:competence protein ComEC|nr:ComEC/Rec2 family competence protein [Pyrinomonadaceae bacterium]